MLDLLATIWFAAFAVTAAVFVAVVVIQNAVSRLRAAGRAVQRAAHRSGQNTAAPSQVATSGARAA